MDNKVMESDVTFNFILILTILLSFYLLFYDQFYLTIFANIL